MNKLARSITKWTKACDKRLNRLISYIYHTCEYKQYCHVGNTAKQCRPGTCFKTLTSREILKIRNPLQEEHCAYSEVMHFLQISWMCKKQTAVSHSSTESEIIFLDTGLRLDGLPFSVLGNVSRVSDRSGQPDNDVQKRHKSQKKSMCWKTLIVFP